MAPPADSDYLTSPKKSKNPKSHDEKKHKNKKKKHNHLTVEEVPLSVDTEPKKPKHMDGHSEKRRKKSKKAEKIEIVVEGKGGDDEKVRRAMEDERFSAARRDPRFRPMRRKESKVAVDERFSRMMTDASFASSSAPVDKRGRRRKRGSKESTMMHYYLNEEEEQEQEQGDKKEKKEKVIKEEDDDEEMEGEEEEEESSSSDEEEDDEDDDEHSVSSDIAHYLMGRHEDTQMTDKETHRLAVVNMDWDHIKAVDLYMVMTSCLPKGGRVLSVSVYASEFGLKCMEIESTQGPFALVNDNDDDTEYDSETDNNKLRTYELNRLRYYYAVVVCDSSATANHLYMTLDGTEFLKTANVFDLQFVPDSMEFKHPARDIATEAPLSYREPNFETRALQHSRVKLTWDDDEPERKKVLRRRFTEDQLDELDAYLACDDNAPDDDGVDNYGEESSPDGGTKEKLTKEKLALLLQGDNSDEEKSDDKDMEITFNTQLEDLSKRILESKGNEEKTVWEKHQEKMKEKRKAGKRRSKDSSDDEDYGSQEEHDEDDDFFDEECSDDENRPAKKHKTKAKDKFKRKEKDKSSEEQNVHEATRAELELLLTADHDVGNGAKGYNLKPKKGKKGKKDKEKNTVDKLPEVDISKDERFSAMFNSHLFALDPTDPQYKRSAAFMRKQYKRGAHADSVERVPPMGSTLPPDEVATENGNQQPDGASMEKIQILSAVKSLKRNLNAFKNSSTGGQ